MNALKTVRLAVLAAIAWGTAAGAQPPLPPITFSVDELTDELTVAVARVDLERLDIDAMRGFIAEQYAGPAGDEGLRRRMEALCNRLDRVKAALAGTQAREAYVVMSLNHFGWVPPVFFAFPQTAGLDPRTVGTLLDGPGNQAAGVAHGALVIAPNPGVIRRLADAPARDETTWTEALAAAPPGDLQFAVRPYAGWERVVHELMPRLPRAMGDGPSTILTDGFVRMNGVLNLPPEGLLRATVVSRSSAAAEALQQALKQGLSHLPAEPPNPLQKALLDALVPVQRGDRLAVTLGAAETAQLLELLLRSTTSPPP